MANKEVCQGDLFLFFGTFRRVEEDGDGGWRYVRTAPKVHLLFGWLQVHEVLKLRTDVEFDRALGKYPWLKDHPHLNGSFRDLVDNSRRQPNNTVYVSTQKLNITGTDAPGGGVFQKEERRIILTEPEEVKRGASCRRSDWRPPEWFWPARGRRRIRRKVKFRRRDAKWIHVVPEGPGQDFVVDVDDA